MKTCQQGRSQTILIVEDDKNVYDTLSQLLRGEGYRTVWAESGGQAIKTMASVAPALIVLDLMLPDRHGIEVLGQIKSMTRDVPVIILTGFGSTDTVRSAMEMGAFDYLTKPSDLSEFCGVVRAALESERRCGAASPAAQ
ncbi:response regulator [Candidatus Poribacteria bacterium]|nr:response regulator [Candidatus Poribacteria bacterium]